MALACYAYNLSLQLRPVAAYCCVYALDAVEVLRRHGYDARMEGGLPDWRLAGNPVRTSAS